MIYKYLPSSLYRGKEKWTRRNFEYMYVHHISNFFLIVICFTQRTKMKKTKKGLKLSGATTQLFQSFFNLKNYSIYIACI